VPPVEIETAVPTLKVMRLQKPALDMPTAGMLEAKCILGAAMCLPDSFGVIHVGETFTAYLGALNVSKTLNVTRLTVTAQLSTPSQRWHLASRLDEGNEAGGVDVPPEGGIDAIVSHALEEVGQHILRVEVGYGGRDGSVKSLRKFYRFQVSNPLIIKEVTYRSGDSCCFVSISLKNNGAETKGGLTICEAEFDSLPGLAAERVDKSWRKQNEFTATELFDECGRLEAGASKRYLFKVTSLSSQTPPSKGIAAGDELGKAIFTWRKACGEMGRMASPPVICPSMNPMIDQNDPAATMEGRNSDFVIHVQGSGISVDVANAAAARATDSNFARSSLDQSLPVTVEPVDPPSTMKQGVPQQIKFLIVNHSNKFMTLQLQFRMEHMKGLSVCGPSFKNLEEVPGIGGSTTVSMRFIPLAAGLLKLQGCCVVDLATGATVAQPPLLNVLVEPKTN